MMSALPQQTSWSRFKSWPPTTLDLVQGDLGDPQREIQFSRQRGDEHNDLSNIEKHLKTFTGLAEIAKSKVL